jgi:mono/diheme cytochrome c family protein
MKMKARLSWRIVAALIIPAGMLFFSSCEKYAYQLETVDPEEPVLFQTQIQPIFTTNCIACHKGSRNPDLRNGFSYASLTGGGYVTTPADGSKLYKQMVSSSHAAFTLDTEKQLVLLWIGQGALNN